MPCSTTPGRCCRASELVERGLASPPPANTPGPFALGDPAGVGELLADAGFAGIDVQALDVVQRHPSFDVFWETTLDVSRSFHDAALSRPEAEIAGDPRRPRGAACDPTPRRTASSPYPGAPWSRPRTRSDSLRAQMLYDDDANLELLDGKTVAIIGYGSQGHAHALNLKDSGVDVVVGLREDSSSAASAREQGLEVVSIADAASRGDLVMMLVPDELHRQVWESEVRDGIAAGNMLLFGHGFSIHYGEVQPPADVDVAMVAPKGPGHLVRRQFTEGSGVPGLLAVAQDASGNARAARARLREGHRLHPRRRDRDDLQGRDRDRPVRRAGGALRRGLGARASRF